MTDEDPIVRWFTHEDADAIIRIHSENLESFEEGPLSREFVLQSAQRPDFRFMVAQANGEVAGFLGVLYYKAVGRAELGPIGMKKELQNHGIGSRMVEKMLSFMKEEGVRRVIVHVKAQNHNAIKFFMDNGFVFEAYLRRYTFEGEDVLQMVHFTA